MQQNKFKYNFFSVGIFLAWMCLGGVSVEAQLADASEPTGVVPPVPETLGREPLRLEPPAVKKGLESSSRRWQNTIPRNSKQFGVILAIFAGLMLLWRLAKGRDSGLPADLVEVYGKVPLNGKQSLHLVRIGGRLLVLIESSQGMQRLAEISDPDEVQSVLDQLGKGHVRRLPTNLQGLVTDRNLSSFRAG
ncbi:MAG: FliO/MopB family protein [Planctomycetaceae bacterium]|nr:FliO/MopB family protein [Planctomycetaceae bacterium]